MARYLEERPDEVRARTVLDFATGSGLVAIAAVRAGAASVVAADIDPFAEAAAGLNARANGVRYEFVSRDLLLEEPPDVEVLLAADTWYEGPFAERVRPWLQAAADRGIRVLVGDPGRRYLPDGWLEELAAYEVETTTLLEDHAVVTSRVFVVRPGRVTSTPFTRSLGGRSPRTNRITHPEDRPCLFPGSAARSSPRPPPCWP